MSKSPPAHIFDDGELREVRPVRRAVDPLEQDIELGALLKHKESAEFYRVISKYYQKEFDLVKAPFFFNQNRKTVTRNTICNEYEVLYYGAVFPYDKKKVIFSGTEWKCRLEFLEGVFTVTRCDYLEIDYNDQYSVVHFKDSEGRESSVPIAYFRYIFDLV